MIRWVIAMLVWGVGVALQLQQSRLAPLSWAQGGCLMGGVALLLALVLMRSPARRAPAWWLLCLASGVLGWGTTDWRAHARLAQALPLSMQAQDLVLVGRIDSLPDASPQGWRIEVVAMRYEFQGQTWDATRLGPHTQRLPQRITLYWPQASSATEKPQSGQVWRWPVRLQSPVRVGNPGGFDLPLWLFERGVRATGSVRGQGAASQLIQPCGGWWTVGAVDRLRQSIREAIGVQVPDARLAGVLAGLAIGDQAAIVKEDWDVFRKTGVSHLVSISGLHIAMVGWFGGGVLAFGWRRSARLMHRCPAPQVQLVATVLVAWLYAVLAGWSIPAQRTVCMMVVWALLRWWGKQWPWPLVWVVAAVVLTVWDPWALTQAGFWLSWMAVGVLMSSGAAPVTEWPAVMPWWRHAGHGVVEAIRTQRLATIALTPLAAVFFHQVSVVGFVANLVAIPVFTVLVTPLALLGVVCAPLWSVAAWMLGLLIKVLALMSAWPWAMVAVEALPWGVSIAAVLSAWVLVLPIPWRWRCLGLPALLPLCCLPASWGLIPPPGQGQFSVLALDVGQGTAVLVRTARHALLFDAGPKGLDASDAGQRVVVPVLQTLGIKRLDELIISHGDADHVGGAASVVAAIPVALLRSSLEDEHPLRQTMALGRMRPQVRCEAGQQWVWDGVMFTVLHPTAIDYARRDVLPSNALSCVLKVQAAPGREQVQGASVLLSGDAEAAQEAAMVDRARATAAGLASLQSTVLIVPHHGSSTSSTAAFLAAVQPDQAVMQVGRRNPYGHPSAQVVARYDELGIARVASPACGAFIWDSASPVPASTQPLSGDARQQLQRGQCWRQRVSHYWAE